MKASERHCIHVPSHQPRGERWPWVWWPESRISIQYVLCIINYHIWVMLLLILFAKLNMNFFWWKLFSQITFSSNFHIAFWPLTGSRPDNGSQTQSSGSGCKEYQELVYQSEEDQGNLPHAEHVQPRCDTEVSYCWVLGGYSWSGQSAPCSPTWAG